MQPISAFEHYQGRTRISYPSSPYYDTHHHYQHHHHRQQQEHPSCSPPHHHYHHYDEYHHGYHHQHPHYSSNSENIGNNNIHYSHHNQHLQNHQHQHHRQQQRVPTSILVCNPVTPDNKENNHGNSNKNNMIFRSQFVQGGNGDNGDDGDDTSPEELCAANVLISLSPKFATLGTPSPATENKRVINKIEPSPSSSPATSRSRSFESESTYADHWRGELSTYAGSCSNSSANSSGDAASVSESSVATPTTTSFADNNSNNNNSNWYSGSISLALPEDDDVLSPLHCFMRRYCVEAFSATKDDISTPRYGKSHGVKVVEGQVGIRCLYCKHRAVNQRPERAVCFPSSLKNIYHSIETWQRRHSLVCTDISPWVKRSLTELMQSCKSRAGGRRQYWEDSAKLLGMVDTPEGVRFAQQPGLVSAMAVSSSLSNNPNVVTNGESSDYVSYPVVAEGDRHLVTNYLFLLMEQMETCQFTEQDRIGGRSKIKDNRVGFPGMQCKHCRGKAGFGRYFPSSVQALALANSDRNIYNHIQKCRKCPASIKNHLVRLSQQQSLAKNKRGLRKLFFRRVWVAMHGEQGDDEMES